MSLEPEGSPRAANIFINYRREDTAGYAGRLFDRLSQHFPGRLFMDIDTIEPGVDFAEVIDQAVSCCEVLIVMIGREWLNITDAAGRRRLENPADFVRLEVAAALERDIRVIPVLVEGASMPQPEQLPPDLAKLARRNALELSDGRWAFDVDRLIQTIERVLREKAPVAPLPAPAAASLPAPAGKARRPGAWMALAAVVALIVAGWIGWRLTAGGEKPGAPLPGAIVDTEPPAPDTEPPPPDTCKQGFVWREARPDDHVCVTPETRQQAAEDNLQAAARREPEGGPWGPDTCLAGYVWREAYKDDHVCVTPETREQTRLDNSQADERLAAG